MPITFLRQKVVLIPQKVIKETEKLFLNFKKGEQRFEGVVYWVGKETDGGFLITRVVTPRAMMTPVSFQVTAEENARIMTDLVKKGEQIVVQISSRPPGSDLNISIFDEEMGFLPFEGMLAMIVADYGVEGLLPFSERTALFLFQNGKFEKIPSSTADSYLALIS